MLIIREDMLIYLQLKVALDTDLMFHIKTIERNQRFDNKNVYLLSF